MSKFKYCFNCQSTRIHNLHSGCSNCGTTRADLGGKHNYPKTRADTGPRPNAGAKRKLKNPRTISVTFEQYQLDWLDTRGDRQGVLRGLVEGAMKLPQP